jgi:hypothetical protein
MALLRPRVIDSRHPMLEPFAMRAFARTPLTACPMGAKYAA